MNAGQTIPESAVDPVCGKTFDPRQVKITASDNYGTHYFCSDACRRRFNNADTKTKKGFWKRYTDRLKDTHCTQTPPECR
jgi:YHS domain-containing protein